MEKSFAREQSDARSYKVRTEDGRLYLRNRRHLRFSRESFCLDQEHSEPEPFPEQPQCNDDSVPTIVSSKPTQATPTSDLPNTPVSTHVHRSMQPASASPMKTRT